MPPIEVTLLGIIIEVKPLQLLKAFSPIEVTLLGIVTEVKSTQSAKASLVITLVPSFII